MSKDGCLFCGKVAALHQQKNPDLVWEFSQSVLFLGPWQFYHGYCVLVTRLHATELSQLNDEDRLVHLDEMCLAAKAIEDCFHPKKMNYELLGNQVPHIHWHLVPRYDSDPEFRHAMWLALDRAKDDRVRRRQLEHGPITRADTIALLQRQLTHLTSQLT